MIKTKLLSCALISTLALSSYGANCPPGYSISISGSGSGNCGSTDSFSVSTQNSWDTYSWSITPVAGTILEQALISSPNTQSTDVTAYFLFRSDTTLTCSWKLKCIATAAEDIQCEAETTINITIPDEAGEVDIEPRYNIFPRTNASTNKYWAYYGKTSFTGPSSWEPEVAPELLESIFHDKIYAHEEKHLQDLADTDYLEQWIGQTIFEQEL